MWSLVWQYGDTEIVKMPKKIMGERPVKYIQRETAQKNAVKMILIV